MDLINVNDSSDVNVLYRYTSNMGGDNIRLNRYKIIKETKCGYWIRLHDGFSDKKWVGKNTTKRFAHITQNEALISFMYRKKKQIRILKSRLNDAEHLLSIANREISNLNL